MKIGELCRQTGMPASTLRFYDGMGLLPSQRSQSNYRIFSEETVAQVRRIQSLRALDLSLPEIARMLSWTGENCREVCALIEARLAQVRLRIAQLREVEDELSRLSNLCQGGGDCRIIASLAENPGGQNHR